MAALKELRDRIAGASAEDQWSVLDALKAFLPRTGTTVNNLFWSFYDSCLDVAAYESAAFAAVRAKLPGKAVILKQARPWLFQAKQSCAFLQWEGTGNFSATRVCFAATDALAICAALVAAIMEDGNG